MEHVVVAGPMEFVVTDHPSMKLSAKLSSEQREYLVKLGAATGRQVVPIDFRLYRELLNMDLIVDKGRRLALSKLGHEVIRFL